MKDNLLVAPVRVILESHPACNLYNSPKSGWFNDKGEELLRLQKPLITPPPPLEEFCYSLCDKDIVWSSNLSENLSPYKYAYTDDLFEEQISINSLADAKAFLKEKSPFAFILPQLLHLKGIADEDDATHLCSENDYLKNVLLHIETFHLIRDAYCALSDHLLDYASCEKAIIAFYKCLTALEHQKLHALFDISHRESNAIDVQFENDEAFIMLRTNTMDEAIRLTLSSCQNFISKMILNETTGVHLKQNPHDFVFEYHCPTLSTAMYEKMLLADFNKDEYKQCAKCSTYFKVDKRHPQTLCDTHMAPRRRKRQNVSMKDRAAEAESQSFIDD